MSLDSQMEFIKKNIDVLMEYFDILKQEIDDECNIQHLTLLKFNDAICDIYEEGISLIRKLIYFVKY